ARSRSPDNSFPVRSAAKHPPWWCNGREFPAARAPSPGRFPRIAIAAERCALEPFVASEGLLVEAVPAGSNPNRPPAGFFPRYKTTNDLSARTKTRIAPLIQGAALPLGRRTARAASCIIRNQRCWRRARPRFSVPPQVRSAGRIISLTASLGVHYMSGCRAVARLTRRRSASRRRQKKRGGGGNDTEV